MDLDMATGGTDDGTAGIIGGGLDPVVVGAQGYYNNGIGGSATGGGSPATEPSATNNLSNLYVIFQNASLNSNIISGNGHTTDNTTTKEHIVGMDNENVFTFMYAVSCSGYIVNLTLLFTICCRQKFRRATNYLLANLCVSSLLFLMVVNLRIYERTHGPIWTYTETNCMAWSVIRRIPQALASLTIVAISCDRSQAARMVVNRPCSADITKKILRIWIIAILTTLPRGLFYRFMPELETSVFVYKCSPVAVGPNGIVNFLYAFIHLISIFMLPMCILICDIYSTVQKIVFLKSRQQTPMNHQDTHEVQNTQLHKKQLQLLRNSCLFAGLFLVCWLPWGIYQNLGDLPKSTVSTDFAHLIYIHFKTVRYVPFTCTAFLPLLLVVCTYDASVFSLWKKCFRRDAGSQASTTPGAYYRVNDLQGRGGGGGNAVGGRVELLQNRPRPVRVLVNNVHAHHPCQNIDEAEEENDV